MWFGKCSLQVRFSKAKCNKCRKLQPYMGGCPSGLLKPFVEWWNVGSKPTSAHLHPSCIGIFLIWLPHSGFWRFTGEPTIPVRGGCGGTRFGGFCGSLPIPFFFCSGPRVFLEFFLGLGLYEPVHLIGAETVLGLILGRDICKTYDFIILVIHNAKKCKIRNV
jgi:hypothetical protein